MPVSERSLKFPQLPPSGVADDREVNLGPAGVQTGKAISPSARR